MGAKAKPKSVSCKNHRHFDGSFFARQNFTFLPGQSVFAK